MTKKIKIYGAGTLALVAGVACGSWWLSHRNLSAKILQEADEVSKHYQLWTAKLTGSNEISNCKGKFIISGALEIIFPAEFSNFLKSDSANANKAAQNQTLKGDAGFSSVIKPEDEFSKGGASLLSSRTIDVPGAAQASWVTLEGKRKLQIIVSATQSKELMVSNCMLKGKLVSPSIFALILTGEVGATGLKGEWAAVNSALDDHSHGEFQMDLKAGVGSQQPIAGPEDLTLQFAKDSAHLSWKASPAVNAFKAYVSQGSELNRKTAAQKLINTNYFDVSDLAPHAAYAFAVSSIVGKEESKISEVVIGVMGEPLVASQIAVGDNHACAVVSGGEVICWGQNKFGQLGNGKVGTRGIAVPVPKITTVKALSAGTDFTCAVLLDGHVRCWGKNDNGELGFAPKPGSYGPVEVPDTSTAIDIHSRGHQTCAILANELVKCWGLGVTDGPASPVLHMRVVVQTKAIACALNSSKEAWCWTVTGSQPKRMSVDVEEISANDNAVCAVRANRRVKCWSDLTTGAARDELAATAEKSENVLHLSMNNNFACAFTADESVFCWGKNDRGQLSQANRTQSQAPLSAEISKFRPKGRIHLGADFACDLNAESHVYCWGSNEFGQLGNGVGQYSSTPQLVLK